MRDENFENLLLQWMSGIIPSNTDLLKIEKILQTVYRYLQVTGDCDALKSRLSVELERLSWMKDNRKKS